MKLSFSLPSRKLLKLFNRIIQWWSFTKVLCLLKFFNSGVFYTGLIKQWLDF